MASECPFLSIVLSEHLKGRLLHRGHPARAEMNPSIHHLCLQYLQDTCPHCISSNCWSLASTGHDHILKQHKIRLNLLILVYPITRGQKERGNQGTGPLQGTKTFCMKTSKSAALVQDFKVSRFQGFKISPGFSSWAPGRCHHSLFHCCAFTLKLATYRQKAQGIFRLTNLQESVL